MTSRKILLTCLPALLAGSVLASGGGGGGSRAMRVPDTDYEIALRAIQSEDYGTAIQRLERYATRAPNDANVWNWLGYANRKSGHLDAAFDNYDKALKIDPKHRGAHEYLGEAYLMTGNLAKAEEHLRILGGLCWLPCEEERDLKKAVATYKAKSTVSVKP